MIETLISPPAPPPPPATGQPATGQPRILTRQAVAARDGVTLATDVYLPASAGPHPVVVHRTPYGRTAPFLLRLALRLVREGLAVVLQDCRGRNASDGEADWRREEDDGRDTLAWLAEQPWCGGRAGLLGISIGTLPLVPLAAAPPAGGVEVAALVNVMGAADLQTFFYRGGALVLHWALPWLHLTAGRETVRGVDGRLPWHELYRHLPLAEVAGGDGFDPGLWRQIVAQPGGGPVWEGLAGGDLLASLRVPSLHVSGWSDFLLAPTLDTYRRSAGGAELVIGPWDHASLFAGPELPEILAAWFADRLKERPAGEGGGRPPAVLLRLEGETAWLEADAFPPRGARRLELFLDAGPGAGEATLVPERPARAGELRYVYDPADPVPTDGGPLWPFPAAGLRPGPADASAVEARSDVLTFTGPVLAEDLRLAGPAELELWCASSAPATDFTARLVDVDPGGTPRVVQDGIVRLPPHGAAAGAPRRAVVGLAAAGHRFRRGHRLRLEVSSSNFPKYDRHLNGAETPGLAGEPAIAEQRVLCGGDAASRLVLTVLDGAGEAELADPAAALRGERPAPSGGARRRSRRLLAPLAAAVRRLAAMLEAQTAKPSGAAGRVVGVLLLLVNPRLNRWTLEPLRVAPTDEVLEIGFGPGATVRRLARRAARGRVAGIDHSEVMVRQARRRNAAAIRRGQVDLRLGDVAALPFPGASFDKVVAVNSVQLWPDPVEDLRRVRRVLRPGGLVALSLGQPRWTLGEAAVRAAARRLGGQLAAAGFTLVAIEVRRLGFLHAYRAVARRPEAGAD